MVTLHELSIALSLLDEIGEAATREGATSVRSVRLRVGRSSGIAREALLFAWELARADTVAAEAVLHIEDIDATVYCERCQCECSPVAGEGLTCGTCGAVASALRHGRELELVAMEVSG